MHAKGEDRAMPLLLKVVLSVWENASRDQRELAAAREAGFDVLVMAKGARGDHFKKEDVAGFEVLRFSMTPFGDARCMMRLNIYLSMIRWTFWIRRIKPDVISGHDLKALFVAYLSTLRSPRYKRPKLIYDSHEFEIGRNAKRNRVKKFFFLHLEKFLLSKSVFSIMVNDGIADRVVQIHKLKTRPLVVRNVPPYFNLDTQATMDRRKEFLKRLGMPKETFLLMYHGGVVQNRGIETLIHAVTATDNTAAIILGNGKPEYVNHLHDMCEKQGISNRILFLRAVPLSILSEYAGAADVGMALIEGICENHYLSLPNKFFENIQSLTPMIVSGFPEMKRLIDLYEIGLTVDPESQEDVLSAVNRMQGDAELYQRFKNNLVQAKEDLCWENEKAALVAAYRDIYNAFN